ncbi:hypothetical protein SUDANB121_02952 [Nocardiopsis dassonvillei]|uniref:hypothetical protein n=1 Tax=Nocardiopsis dassonvillei TaxID=2014 RepID=UPI003F567D74
MPSRFLSPTRVAAGASAAAVLAVLAPALPAAAGEEVCAHAREDGSCVLYLNGVAEAPEVREDGAWLEVTGGDPRCRTEAGVPVDVLPGEDGVFHLFPGESPVHCDVTVPARDGGAAGREGPAGGAGEVPAPGEDGAGAGAPGGPAPEPREGAPAGDAVPPDASGAEEPGSAAGALGAAETGGPATDPAPSPGPSAPPAPDCPEREVQRFAVERGGTCGGASFAQWPDPEAAAGQAARPAFTDLADRLGVSVFDLAEHLGVDGVRGVSRRTVDELAAMLGITPQELVERAEEAAAAVLAEEAGKPVAGGPPAGLPGLSADLPGLPGVLPGLSGSLAGKPTRLPETGPRTAVLVHGGVLLGTAGALILLLTRRRLPS